MDQHPETAEVIILGSKEAIICFLLNNDMFLYMQYFKKELGEYKKNFHFSNNKAKFLKFENI